MLCAPSLLDPAAEELKLADVNGRPTAVDVARTARTLLGERFDSGSFMYVLMRAYDVEYHAACEAFRWQGFGDGPLSDDALETLLAPWLTAR
ncbi:hypothetical protein [Amycolatopsis benzoatilytica]|uniref:hypothetical protein n=1 Tax=Amycolatopsis benzoatilytica TaxID=346045 RepID=UPI00036A7FA4|nr:hypothetical protein [Amycolatopsis benzoatilytica]